jgi:hypothetical protein
LGIFGLKRYHLATLVSTTLKRVRFPRTEQRIKKRCYIRQRCLCNYIRCMCLGIAIYSRPVCVVFDKALHTSLRRCWSNKICPKWVTVNWWGHFIFQQKKRFLPNLFKYTLERKLFFVFCSRLELCQVDCRAQETDLRQKSADSTGGGKLITFSNNFPANF